MMLPTRWMRSGGTPSLNRFSSPSGEGVRRISASRSVTTRLTSSGMRMSKLRSPASTWATGIQSLAATTLQASVELTSPTTTTRSGLRSRQTFSNSTMTRAVCSAWDPEPTPM